MEIDALDLPDLVVAIREGRLTATRLVESCLESYRESEPLIRAFAWVDPAQALRAAGRIDRKLARGAAGGLLAGIPIGVKDIFDTAGMPTEFGSEIFKGRRPRRSAATLRRLQGEDAVIFGKTVTAELAYFSPGPTRNPWNLERTSGGSSMGSAAAVAAGVVPGSLGTQTNGSVIRPAAFCGVVGFKPSFGRLPTDGVMTFSHTLDHVGVFARSVAGASLVMAALAGDATEGPAGDTTAPRLAAVRTRDWSSAETAMKHRFEADLAALGAAGAQVDTPAFPDELDDALPVHRVIMAVEGLASVGPRVKSHRDLLSPVLRDLLDEAAGTSKVAYKAALRQRQRLIDLCQEWMAPYDAVLTIPTTGEAPGLETTGDPRFCTRWTLVGAPAIVLPTGFGPAGLPLGLQIVGRPGQDARLLRVALWVERVLGRPTWHGPRPHREVA